MIAEPLPATAVDTKPSSSLGAGLGAVSVAVTAKMPFVRVATKTGPASWFSGPAPNATTEPSEEMPMDWPAPAPEVPAGGSTWLACVEVLPDLVNTYALPSPPLEEGEPTATVVPLPETATVMPKLSGAAVLAPISRAVCVQGVPDLVNTSAARVLLLAPSGAATTVWASPEIATDVPSWSFESALGGVSSALWENPWPLLVKT